MTPETGGRLMGQIFQREWPDFKGVWVFLTIRPVSIGFSGIDPRPKVANGNQPITIGLTGNWTPLMARLGRHELAIPLLLRASDFSFDVNAYAQSNPHRPARFFNGGARAGAESFS